MDLRMRWRSGARIPMLLAPIFFCCCAAFNRWRSQLIAETKKKNKNKRRQLQQITGQWCIVEMHWNLIYHFAICGVCAISTGPDPLEYPIRFLFFYLRLSLLRMFFQLLSRTRVVDERIAKTDGPHSRDVVRLCHHCRSSCSPPEQERVKKNTRIYIEINSECGACRWSCVHFYCRHSRQVIYIFRRATNVATTKKTKATRTKKSRIAMNKCELISFVSLKYAVEPNPNRPDFS